MAKKKEIRGSLVPSKYSSSIGKSGIYKPKKKKQKFKITIDKVYPKPKSKYEDTILEAKRRARHMLENHPQGVARIKQLKDDGKSYKSKTSHYWAKNRETGRDRIVGL